MKVKSAKSPKGIPRRTLTAVELEMMNIIWRLGSCTVSQVRDALRPERELAYTSVSTIIRILEQKGFVTSEKAGRGHVYSAAMSKQSYQAMSLEHLVTKVFDAAPSLLVQRLLDSDSLTEEELARIRTMLRKKGS
jgi:BlaI family transcriptional regulator, penicillinase repressor